MLYERKAEVWWEAVQVQIDAVMLCDAVVLSYTNDEED